MPARRLFIGLQLPEEVATRLLRQVEPTLLDDAGERPRDVRIHGPEELHVTLAFLGEIEEPVARDLGGVLREEVRGLLAPELRLSGTGVFPGRGRPRVLWVGIEEEAQAAGRLDALRNRVWQAALSVGWRPARKERERPFRPHVTLARLRPGAPQPHPAFERLDFDHPWLPVEVALIESRPGDRDERYRALSAVPLVVRPG